jgi:KDO2-lipid IV(A) lauroyltransferase
VRAAALRAALRLLSLLGLSTQRRLGRFLGRVFAAFDTESRRVTRINVDLCFPELEPAAREALVGDSLAHSAMLATELGTVYHCPPERWRDFTVDIEGEPLFETALAGGSGVLLLVPHLGNWEFLSLMLGQLGVTALYDPPKQRALERFVVEARNRAGAHMLPIDAAGLRGFYQALAEGGLGALLPDQVPRRQAGVYADFFGRPALTMTFWHRVARRTGARVLMGAAIRRPGGFLVRIADPGPGVVDPDPTLAAAAMNAAIEAWVREDPAQYQWEYRRFRRPPPGTPNPYDQRP